MIVLVLVNSQYFIFPKLNKFKNNNKSGNFTFKVINDQLVTFFVPSECLSVKICCSWSSDKFAKRATCEFFSALSCLLDQDLKGQCRQKNWAVLRWFLPYFKEKENCTAA